MSTSIVIELLCMKQAENENYNVEQQKIQYCSVYSLQKF